VSKSYRNFALFLFLSRIQLCFSLQSQCLHLFPFLSWLLAPSLFDFIVWSLCPSSPLPDLALQVL
jgi:hypothetical protein